MLKRKPQFDKSKCRDAVSDLGALTTRAVPSPTILSPNHIITLTPIYLGPKIDFLLKNIKGVLAHL